MSRSQRSSRRRPACLAPALLVALGCININIYFPEAQIQEAAAEIVREVRSSDDTPPPPAVTPQSPPSSSREEPQAPAPDSNDRTTGALELLRLWGTAYAESPATVMDAVTDAKDETDIKIDVQSDVIKKIKQAIKARFAMLRPFYEKGAVGEGADGYLALKDTEALSLKERRDVQTLLKDENADRKKLYLEILVANSIEDSYLDRVAKLFAPEWQKQSKAGWWVQAADGKWSKKGEEKKS